MASPDWRANRPLSAVLAQGAARFNFYQLVRLILVEHGLDLSQLERGVRFTAHLGQAFPAHEVVRAGPGSPGSPGASTTSIETVNYVLAGLLGPLPEALVDHWLDRRDEGTAVWARFLDIFNQRINALRYRLRAGVHPGLNSQPPEQTPLAHMLLSSAGLAEPLLRGQLRLPERSIAALAGLLVDRHRSATLLTRVLSRFVEAPVSLEPLAGDWRAVATVWCTRLGLRGSAHRLGQDCRLGRTAWRPASAVRLVVGPLPYRCFCHLLPKWPRQAGKPGDLHPVFSWLVRFLSDCRHDAWVVLRLAAGEAPPATLSARHRRLAPGGVDFGLRLGQTAWLHGHRGTERSARFLIRAVEVTV